MNAHSPKTPAPSDRSVANTSVQKKNNEQDASFEDQRPHTLQAKSLQAIADDSPQTKKAAQLQHAADKNKKKIPIQKKENKTGLPDTLKSGIENLSGMAMDDVKVHYNSPAPAQLNAHAYAQGSDIHVASGQEKHLPHEAWHVVQQKQGRVKPTKQLKAQIAVNDDHGLEKEADVMGMKALQAKTDTTITLQQKTVSSSAEPVQRAAKEVEVTWLVTHLVRKMNGSIFGGADFKEGEIGDAGELTLGQRITIDDEKTFLSRRGPNQEDPKNRAKDEQSDPHVIWHHVLVMRGKDVSPQNLYIRENTYATAKKEHAGLSLNDQKLLTNLVHTACDKGRNFKGEWDAFLGVGSTQQRRVQWMYALSQLGNLLEANYYNLSIARQQNMKPETGIQLMIPEVNKLFEKTTPTTIGPSLIVNGMSEGGNYTGWKNLAAMRNYLQIPFDTFVNIYQNGNASVKARISHTLTSSDRNIEKFITLMTDAASEGILSGPEGELVKLFTGYPTSKQGLGLLLPNGVTGLREIYLTGKGITKKQIANWDYDETPENFKQWLASKGYTPEVVWKALKIVMENNTIELAAVEALWDTNINQDFY